MEALTRAKLIEEAVDELTSLVNRIKKEPLARRTKEVFMRRRKEADEIWRSIEEMRNEAQGAGEITRFAFIGEEVFKGAESVFARLGEILDGWKLKWEGEGGESVSRALLNQRLIKLAIVEKVVERYTNWEQEDRSLDDLSFMEGKLTRVLNEFEQAHEKIPTGHSGHKELELEAVRVRDTIISIISGIHVRLDELENNTEPPVVRAPASDEGSMTQLERVLEMMMKTMGRNNHPSPHHNINLPRLDIPEFDGNIQNWLYFKGCFISAVHSNSSIDNVLKMRYLQKSVVGEAKGMITHFSLTSENYTTAWELLVKRYDNRKILINSYLGKLLNTTAAKHDRAAELKRVLDDFREALCSLKNLGEEIGNSMVVFLLVNKLPGETVKDWEQQCRDLDDVPGFDKLDKYIESRINMLSILESKNEAANFRKYNDTSVSIPNICIVCGGDHQLYKCDGFLSQSPAERNERNCVRSACVII